MTHKGDRQVAPTGRDGDGCPKLPGGLDSSLIESGTGSAGMTSQGHSVLCPYHSYEATIWRVIPIAPGFRMLQILTASEQAKSMRLKSWKTFGS